MYSEYPQPPFKSPSFYIILDVLYLIFSILYLIGDSDHQNNFLKYTKPIPVWIIIVQLFSLQSCHPRIITILFGLAFGSLGDLLLLFAGDDNFVLFAMGAGSFLVGHILYVISLLAMARDLAENRTTLREVLRKQPLFIVLWLVLLTFSFWSISYVVDKGSVMQYVLAFYGTCLVLLTMGGFFFYFTTEHLGPIILKAGYLFMFGTIIFFASDNFLAHGKFNQGYKDTIKPWLNSYFIMVTYYVAQFCLGKGTFFVAVHYIEPKEVNTVHEHELAN